MRFTMPRNDGQALQCVTALLELLPPLMTARLLQPEVITRALAEASRVGPHACDFLLRPGRSPSPGTAEALLVCTGLPEDTPFRDAFMVPLLWQNAQLAVHATPVQDHQLKILAGRVCQTLLPQKEAQQWTLCLPAPTAPGAGDPLHQLRKLLSSDGAPCDLSWDSAFAPLAAALWLAAQGGQPQARVFATGKWDPNTGIGPVSGVAAKARCVRDFAAAGGAATGIAPPILFVPAANVAEAAIEGVTVEAFPGPLQQRGEESLTNFALRALQPLLRMLDARPADSDPPEAKFGYHRRLNEIDRTAAADYYRSDVLPAESLLLRQTGRIPTGLKRLVLVYNPRNTALAELVRSALGMQEQQCVRVQFADGADAFSDAADVVRCPVQFHDTDSFQQIIEDLRTTVQPLLEGTQPQEVMWDLTGGKKWMILALERAALPGSWCCYVESTYDRANVLQPGTVRIAFLQRPRPAP